MTARAAVAACSLAIASLARAVPALLVAQQNVSLPHRQAVLTEILGARPKLDPQVPVLDAPMAHLVAQELDEDGRTYPIAWGLADPMFRAAVDEGKIKDPPDSPTIDQAFDAARGLNAEYLLVIVAWQETESVVGHARLYSGRRQVWEDQRSVSASLGGSVDFDTAARSLARTWVQVMAAGPLKGLPQQRRKPTPVPEQGGRPVVSENLAPPSRNVDNSQVLSKSEALFKEGKKIEAVLMLREAVDMEPLDADRRLALVKALSQVDQHGASAREARRAALLFPDRIEFRILAARGWLADGNNEEAIVDLNEAVARDSEGFETRLLLGELQLANLRFAFAVDHLDKAIAKSPTSEGLFFRSLAKFFLADPSASDDLARSRSLLPEGASQDSLFPAAAKIVQSAAEDCAQRLRTLIPRLRLDNRQSDALAELASLKRSVQGGIRILAAVPAPKKHKASQGRLGLALNLLAQAIGDVETHTGSASEAALSEATIGLGEALAQLQLAANALAKELAPATGG